MIIKIKKIYLEIYKVIFGRIAYARKIGVKVGENCRLYTTSFGSEPFLVTIGNKVTVTAGVSFITHDGSAWLMEDSGGRRYLYQPIKIGNSVFIGVNSIILPGVNIEDFVIVAAGSVVTKSVPSGSVVAGVPAKIIGNFYALRDKMLDSYVADSDLDKELNYRERILRVVNYRMKDYLKSDNDGK